MALNVLVIGAGVHGLMSAIELAKKGDRFALKLCLERILSPRKDRPVTFSLLEIESAELHVTNWTMENVGNSQRPVSHSANG